MKHLNRFTISLALLALIVLLFALSGVYRSRLASDPAPNHPGVAPGEEAADAAAVGKPSPAGSPHQLPSSGREPRPSLLEGSEKEEAEALLKLRRRGTLTHPFFLGETPQQAGPPLSGTIHPGTVRPTAGDGEDDTRPQRRVITSPTEAEAQRRGLEQTRRLQQGEVIDFFSVFGRKEQEAQKPEIPPGAEPAAEPRLYPRKK